MTRDVALPFPYTVGMLVQRGRLICYRIFDVGDEIALERAQKALAAGRRVALSRDGAKALVFATPPLDVKVGSRKVELSSAGRVDVEVSTRLFDYGAVSVAMELSIHPGTDLATLLPLCDEVYESPALEAAALREVESLLARLGGAVSRGHGWRVAETYTVIFVEAFEGGKTAADVLAWPLLAKLVVGEPGDKKLSLDQTKDVLKHSTSYFEDDLAVIDWNSAFVLEPSGSRDIPDILELATSQLLELRYYDDLFDRALVRIYDDLAAARRQLGIFRSPYARLTRDVMRRIVELTEFTERVDNALKIIGDFYLARVYEGALRRFRIDSWRASIDGKQALVAQAYDLVKGEMEARRNTFLELVVIVLIFLELALAIFRR
jgi:hypothetical protein